MTFEPDVDAYDDVTAATLTVGERGEQRFVRESVTVEAEHTAPVRQYNLRLESDRLPEDGTAAGDARQPSVAELARDGRAVLDRRERSMSSREFVASQVDGVTTDEIGTMDTTWSGLQVPTASQLCGDLARSQLNVEWEHHLPNPSLQYSEYHDHFFSTWAVDGADCSFPDGDVFATTWHVDSSSDSAGQDGGGGVEGEGEATYWNDDFPLSAGTTYADHDTSVDITETGWVTHDWNREHYGSLWNGLLAKPSVTTW